MDWYDDSTSSDSYEGWHEDDTGFRRAVSRLQGSDGDRRRAYIIERLDVHNYHAPSNDVRSFPRFVSLLHRAGGGGAIRPVECVKFMVNWKGLRDADMERLFRDVLPHHRTLTEVDLDVRDLPARHLKLFIEAILNRTPLSEQTTPTTLSNLAFAAPGYGRRDDATDSANFEENFHAIVELLQQNAVIEKLHFRFHADRNQCQLICQNVVRNTNVRNLYLGVRDAASLDGLAASSSLRILEVRGTFGADAIPKFAFQLRTNETLEHLDLVPEGGFKDNESQALLDLVKTYNFTLQSLGSDLEVDPNVEEQLFNYMRRNDRIRNALRKLKSSPDDAEQQRFEVPAKLLAQALSLGSGMPTALYRILRMDYVVAILVDRLTNKPQATTTATATTTPASESKEPPGGGDPRSSPSAKRRRTDP